MGYAQTCDYIGQIREEEGQDSRVGINRFQNLGFLLSLSRGDCCCQSNTGMPRFIYSSSGIDERVCIRPGEEEKSFFLFSLCDVISRTQKRRSEQEE